ncbi:hypothetical protein AALO_G00125830 [Alosa alosa]|uniref:Claudin n=1 Tax=Alosa alosa TaxID=278164 RepID=A0AAV6GQM9_9TELE|nr:claudin-7-A-like [Alosa alosa]KAG5275907.1 hypothetical protein AALO_G00125830 [Alosa alosa]
MANGCVQIVGCMSAFAGLICLMVATYASEWKILSHSTEGMVKSVVVRIGLWMACSVPVSKRWECTVYDSVLHVPLDIQVTRAIMIISIILSACGLAVVVLGMKYTLCLDKDKHVKNKVAFVGGILITVAGVCSLGIVSWYAHAVVNTQKPRPFLGKCLFLGWGGALLSITGGVLLSCCGLSQSTPRRGYTSPHSVQLASSKVYV